MKRTNKGFSTSEILLIVAIIGILAVFAVSKFTSVLQVAHVAVQTTDLRDVKAAEAGYAVGSNGAYLAHTWKNVPSEAADTTIGFSPSSGVTVKVMLSKSKQGWTGVSTSVHTKKTCYIFMNDGERPAGAPAEMTEGTPDCAP